MSQPITGPSLSMDKVNDIIQFFKDEEIPVYAVGESQYERSVATANFLYRFERPDCVVQPKRTSQVQTIVREAKERKIPITIKNGGHSYAGASTAATGISLDLCKMNNVKLDTDSKIMTLQGGALWGHAYKEFVNKKLNQYVVNGGRCPTVGVSGFLLGGGLSPFTRSFGMGCDTLKEITIVTADGAKVTVKESGNDDPKKDLLFWALCGAGGGNFGVVVEMKLQVQKLRCDNVVAGRYTWWPQKDPCKMESFMETMRNFYTTAWPKQLTIDSSWLCDLSQSNIGVRFLVYHNGDKAEFEKLIKENITDEDLSKPLIKRSLEEPSSLFLHETLVAQWSEETEKSFPQNPSYMIYSSFVFKNNADDIKAITDIIRENMTQFREKFPGERGLLQVTWIHAGGEAASKDSSATAYHWRDCVYHTYIMVQWYEKFLEQDMWNFLDRFKGELRRYSINGQAAFINFPDGRLAPDIHERAYYGENRHALQQIKNVWDESDFFHWDQGVRRPAEELKTETTALRLGLEDSLFTEALESNIVSEKDFYASRISSFNMAMSNREDVPDNGHRWDKPPLANQLASRQWETVTLPSEKIFDRGIYNLNDLGF
ncbi:hypothetical protein TGAMA5MH_09561 [Trichoderma gamsii]|uniref:FAD-binding PCMH-type domain-containing protein n=1 Tax=Trichoderma gamsii TaxID=398673 RepID=A0A2K0SYX7_9HYPO|nr:hypothetical protein TGAMA5MH_09561 [Trichoderma gamsii]